MLKPSPVLSEFAADFRPQQKYLAMSEVEATGMTLSSPSWLQNHYLTISLSLKKKKRLQAQVTWRRARQRQPA